MSPHCSCDRAFLWPIRAQHINTTANQSRELITAADWMWMIQMSAVLQAFTPQSRLAQMLLVSAVVHAESSRGGSTPRITLPNHRQKEKGQKTWQTPPCEFIRFSVTLWTLSFFYKISPDPLQTLFFTSAFYHFQCTKCQRNRNLLKNKHYL